MDEPIVEELDPDECLRLLATQTVGRLAVAEPDEAPHLVPVNYTLLRGSVVFRSAPGTKLRLLVDEPVAFEADSSDPEGRIGWSVVVRGLAYEASDEEMEVEDIRLPVFVERQNSRWVRLVPQSITGRRIVRPSAAAEKLGAPGS
jgi:nitroimidazol reductase NimA-like FMN-containing flavoprotein (pyridoxamine 5'-phosphate oxidase superfamily)